MKKKTFNSDAKLDLKDVVIFFWKEKFLILISSIIITLILSYYFIGKNENIYSAETEINLPDDRDLSFYNLHFTEKNIITEKQFSDLFYQNFIDLNNIESFVNNSDQKNNKFYNENIINIREYFNSKLIREIREDKLQGKETKTYIIKYNDFIKGDLFLVSYLNYIFQITITDINVMAKKLISLKIENYKNNLIISKKIELDKPLLQTRQDQSSLVFQPIDLFFKGSYVLEKKIAQFENFKNSLNDFRMNHNVTFNSTTVKQLNKSNTWWLSLSISLSLIFSIIIAVIKNILKS